MVWQHHFVTHFLLKGLKCLMVLVTPESPSLLAPCGRLQSVLVMAVFALCSWRCWTRAGGTCARRSWRGRCSSPRGSGAWAGLRPRLQSLQAAWGSLQRWEQCCCPSVSCCWAKHSFLSPDRFLNNPDKPNSVKILFSKICFFFFSIAEHFSSYFTLFIHSLDRTAKIRT